MKYYLLRRKVFCSASSLCLLNMNAVEAIAPIAVAQIRITVVSAKTLIINALLKSSPANMSHINSMRLFLGKTIVLKLSLCFLT